MGRGGELRLPSARTICVGVRLPDPAGPDAIDAAHRADPDLDAGEALKLRIPCANGRGRSAGRVDDHDELTGAGVDAYALCRGNETPDLGAMPLVRGPELRVRCRSRGRCGGGPAFIAAGPSPQPAAAADRISSADVLRMEEA